MKTRTLSAWAAALLLLRGAPSQAQTVEAPTITAEDILQRWLARSITSRGIGG